MKRISNFTAVVLLAKFIGLFVCAFVVGGMAVVIVFVVPFLVVKAIGIGWLCWMALGAFLMALALDLR